MESGGTRSQKLHAAELQSTMANSSVKRLKSFADLKGRKLIAGDTESWFNKIQEIAPNAVFSDAYADEEVPCSLIATTLAFYPPVEIDLNSKFGSLVVLAGRNEAAQLIDQYAKKRKLGEVIKLDLTSRDSSETYPDGTVQYGAVTMWFDNRQREVVFLINEKKEQILKKLERSIQRPRLTVEKVFVNWLESAKGSSDCDVTLLCRSGTGSGNFYAFTLFPSQISHIW